MGTGLDGFELLPADDAEPSADDVLDAAAESALEGPDAPVTVDPPVPFGRTWLFNYDTGRFVRHGGSPAEVRGRASLAVWAGMAIRAARFAHPIFSDEFGMDRPESPIGEVVSLVEEASDWGERVRDALTVHDRVSSVDNVDIRYLPSEEMIYVHDLQVVTDEDDLERLPDAMIFTKETD